MDLCLICWACSPSPSLSLSLPLPLDQLGEWDSDSSPVDSLFEQSVWGPSEETICCTGLLPGGQIPPQKYPLEGTVSEHRL